MASIDKYRSRRNRARIRDLFWREWDPIGVNDVEEAKDEYDSYADRAYMMMMEQGRSASEIAGYLYWVSSDYMGLGPSPPSPRLKDLAVTIAEKLIQLRPSFEAASNEPF